MLGNLFTWKLDRKHCVFGGWCDLACESCSGYLFGPKKYECCAPDNPRINGLLSDLGISFLTDVTVSPIIFPKTDRLVPMIKRGDEKYLNSASRVDTVALSLADFITKGKKTKWLSGAQSSIKKIKSNLGRETKIIFICNGKDKMLKENFWPNRQEILREMADLNFDLVVTTNFSILEKQPPMEDFFSILRNHKVFGEMRRLGIRSIPLICWKSKSHLDEWAKWLNANKEALVCLNFQTNKGRIFWERNILDVQYLLGLLTRRVKFLIIGPLVVGRVNKLKSIFGHDFILVTSKLICLARVGKALRYENKSLNKVRAEPQKAFIQSCLDCKRFLLDKI